MAALNLYFRLVLLICVSFGPIRSWAVNIHALYTASCQRELGIVLDVGPRQILLLNLKGEIVKVERYEVIYYATFPLDTVPVAAVLNPGLVPLVEVKTFKKGELVNLLKGWPVDFNRDKISFLSLRGTEVMIDRTSIWKVQFDREVKSVNFLQWPTARYEFVHPYAFSSCAAETTSIAGGGSRLVKVYPQQLLSDPISIKREFDRLAGGHAEVRKYESDQQFYAVPELYSNETSLGLWISSGTRYGASRNRQSNFTPLLSNQYSSGPFGFQSEFRSGSGPLENSVHEEPQTQVFYRMKADYFHFSGMVDPNLLLVGTKYDWSLPDLDRVDIRSNESASLEFGFDYRKLAFEFYLGGAFHVGASNGDLFKEDVISLPRLGFRYQGYTWIANIQGGSSSMNDFETTFLRANFDWKPNRNYRWVLSAIKRDLKFNGRADNSASTPFQVLGESNTLSAYGYFRFRTRYWAGAMLSAESLKKSFGTTALSQSEDKIYPKAGVMLSLTF